MALSCYPPHLRFRVASLVALAGLVTVLGCNLAPGPKGGNKSENGQPDPTASGREVPLKGDPGHLHQTTWDKGAGKSEGTDPHVIFTLKEPQLVSAVRLKMSAQNGSKTAFVEVFWRNSAANDFSEKERHYARNVPTGAEQTLTIPVNDTIDGLRIDPDNQPCTFNITEITLLVPEEKSKQGDSPSPAKGGREFRLTGDPDVLHQTTWETGAGKAQGDDPFVVFILKEPQFVSAIRLKLTVQGSGKSAFVEVFWRNSATNEFSEKERHYTRNVPTGAEQTLTIPVNDTINGLRIDPDNQRSTFRIAEVTLLRPE